MTARPSAGEFGRALARGALLPLVLLLCVDLGIGFAIAGPGQGWLFEDALNRTLQADRTSTLDAVTRTASFIGSAPTTIAICIVFMALVLWRTHRWWIASIPGVALIIEAVTHAVTSTVVNRDRPLVEHLDAAQPTASFPSGHVGASLALVLVLLLFARSLRSFVLRFLVAFVALAYVVVLGYSRLYLGMHHLSDVLVGVLNGLVAGLAGWTFLPRRFRGSTRA